MRFLSVRISGTPNHQIPKHPEQWPKFLHVEIFVFADAISGALLDQLDERVLPESGNCRV